VQSGITITRKRRISERLDGFDIHGRQAFALVQARMFSPYDRQQPRPRRRRVLELLAGLPGSDERLLHHVLRDRPIARQPQCETQQIGAQHLDQTREGPFGRRSARALVHV